MHVRTMLRIALAAMVCLAPCSTLSAQAVNGTLLGTIADASAAAVSGARIIAVQVETDTTRETVTNGSGNFTMPDLPPGTYTVTITAAGFKKEVRDNITLLNNSSLRVDVGMVPGSAAETITVTTAPALLQTDRADISTKIEADQVASLPIGGTRNFQSC